MKNTNTLKIGLCLAGAVSAGAYTAGVMDYLLEALEEWQKRKDQNEPNTPTHNIEISVIGGGSAGGMTGIMTAAAIQDYFEPIRGIGGDLNKPQPQHKLYNAWVDLSDNDMLKVMLDSQDLKNGKLLSLLNSSFIDGIAKKVTTVSNSTPAKRPYFDPNLKVFVSLTNLQGRSHRVPFMGGTTTSDYIVKYHNDYACFMLVNSDADYKKDGWMPLNFQQKLNTVVAEQAAMATGAFPVGLQARTLRRETRYVNDLKLSRINYKDNPIDATEKYYETLNIDGGVLDNEPFELVKEILGMDKKSTNIENLDRTIIMIDPFPSVGKPDAILENSLIPNVFSLLKVLLAQSGIQPSTLQQLTKNSSQHHDLNPFMISPVRYKKNNANEEVKIEGGKALACGAVSGFSGFLNKEFRIHDYFLGRANCEKFLRDYFVVPADTANPIFKEGYNGIIDLKPFVSMHDEKIYLPIIPVFTPRQSQPYMPVFSGGEQWPTVSAKYFDNYKDLLKKRIGLLLFNAIPGPSYKTGAWLAGKIGVNGYFAQKTITQLTEYLKEHELIR